MTNVLKCVEGICRVSYMETFCENKIREKRTGEKLQAAFYLDPLGGYISPSSRQTPPWLSSRIPPRVVFLPIL